MEFWIRGCSPCTKMLIGLDRILCMTKLLFFHCLAFRVESSQMLYSGITVCEHEMRTCYYFYEDYATTFMRISLRWKNILCTQFI